MKEVTKRNRQYKNSKGISNKEYLIGTNAANRVDRELFNDYDYLDKLSPEEFAYLAEFTANLANGSKVNETIMGKDDADKLNRSDCYEDLRREAYRNKNTRQRNAIENNATRDELLVKDPDMKCSIERLTNKAVEAYIQMIDDIDEEIDRHWEANRIYRS